MEKEYEQWIKKADKDLNTAKSNINNEEIEAGAFFLQQSAEKSLKALLIKKTKKLIRTHDLVILSKKLNAPEKIINYCKRLTTLYQETRYPDVKSEEDIKEEINTLLLYAEEVLKDKRKSINIIREFVNNLSKDYNVQKVIFFGSRAAGRPHKDSDIDLIIVSDDFEGVNRIERGAEMYSYWPWLIPVDFICYTTKEFNLLKKRISIVKEALEKGIVIQ